MKLQLSPHDMEMLAGKEGPAVKMAMTIVVRMAEVVEAESLLDITAVLLEAIRNYTAPAAILTTSKDFFFAQASVVADELYSQSISLIALEEAEFSRGDKCHAPHEFNYRR